MNKGLFENLALLEARKKSLEMEIEEAREAVLAEMNKEGVDTAKVGGIGSFTITTRKKWTYSDEVKAGEANIKNLKKVEEESGIAKFEESKSLLFRAQKKDEQENGDEEN